MWVGSVCEDGGVGNTQVAAVIVRRGIGMGRFCAHLIEPPVSSPSEQIVKLSFKHHSCLSHQKHSIFISELPSF